MNNRNQPAEVRIDLVQTIPQTFSEILNENPNSSSMIEFSEDMPQKIVQLCDQMISKKENNNTKFEDISMYDKVINSAMITTEVFVKTWAVWYTLSIVSSKAAFQNLLSASNTGLERVVTQGAWATIIQLIVKLINTSTIGTKSSYIEDNHLKTIFHNKDDWEELRHAISSSNIKYNTPELLQKLDKFRTFRHKNNNNSAGQLVLNNIINDAPGRNWISYMLQTFISNALEDLLAGIGGKTIIEPIISSLVPALFQSIVSVPVSIYKQNVHIPYYIAIENPSWNEKFNQSLEDIKKYLKNLGTGEEIVSLVVGSLGRAFGRCIIEVPSRELLSSLYGDNLSLTEIILKSAQEGCRSGFQQLGITCALYGLKKAEDLNTTIISKNNFQKQIKNINDIVNYFIKLLDRPNIPENIKEITLNQILSLTAYRTTYNKLFNDFQKCGDNKYKKNKVYKEFDKLKDGQMKLFSYVSQNIHNNIDSILSNREHPQAEEERIFSDLETIKQKIQFYLKISTLQDTNNLNTENVSTMDESVRENDLEVPINNGHSRENNNNPTINSNLKQSTFSLDTSSRLSPYIIENEALPKNSQTPKLQKRYFKQSTSSSDASPVSRENNNNPTINSNSKQSTSSSDTSSRLSCYTIENEVLPKNSQIIKLQKRRLGNQQDKKFNCEEEMISYF